MSRRAWNAGRLYLQANGDVLLSATVFESVGGFSIGAVPEEANLQGGSNSIALGSSRDAKVVGALFDSANEPDGSRMISAAPMHVQI